MNFRTLQRFQSQSSNIFAKAQSILTLTFLFICHYTQWIWTNIFCICNCVSYSKHVEIPNEKVHPRLKCAHKPTKNRLKFDALENFHLTRTTSAIRLIQIPTSAWTTRPSRGDERPTNRWVIISLIWTIQLTRVISLTARSPPIGTSPMSFSILTGDKSNRNNNYNTLQAMGKLCFVQLVNICILQLIFSSYGLILVLYLLYLYPNAARVF